MENSEKINPLEELHDRLKIGEATLSLPGLCTSSKAFVVSQVFKNLKVSRKPRHIVLLTNNMKQARILADDLKFFCGEDVVNTFPNISRSRNDVFASELPQISERNRVLERVPNENFITVAPIVSFLQKTLPKNKFSQYSFKLEKGGEYDRDEVIKKLIRAGFVQSPVVENVGEFTFRGGLLDLFTPCLSYPLRLEFFGDEIESIRYFDPETQMTTRKRSPKKVKVVPVREVIFSEENVARGRTNFKSFGDLNGIPKLERDKYLLDIENQIYFSGIDYLLPFFEENLTSPISYFPSDTVFFLDDPLALEDRFESHKEDEKSQYSEALEENRFYSTYDSANISYNDLVGLMGNAVYFDTLELEGVDRRKIRLEVQDNNDIISDMKNARLSSGSILAPLLRKIDTWTTSGFRINFVARTRSQAERLSSLFEEHDLHFSVVDKGKYRPDRNRKIYIGDLAAGFRLYSKSMVFITDEEIFGEKKHINQRKKTQKSDAFLTSFSELKENDFLVHVDHGVGLYHGLSRMGKGESETDFITLEYKDGDKLYIPVYRLNVVQKYTGGGDPQVDKMGSTRWQNTKKKVKESIFAMADELIKIYAAREKHRGYSFQPPDSIYREFEATFPFEETPDQLASIDWVWEDRGRSSSSITCCFIRKASCSSCSDDPTCRATL
jgi:transcription-repair coupling factor (superfamily II helicase)